MQVARVHCDGQCRAAGIGDGSPLLRRTCGLGTPQYVDSASACAWCVFSGLAQSWLAISHQCCKLWPVRLIRAPSHGWTCPLALEGYGRRLGRRSASRTIWIWGAVLLDQSARFGAVSSRYVRDMVRADRPNSVTPLVFAPRCGLKEIAPHTSRLSALPCALHAFNLCRHLPSKYRRLRYLPGGTLHERLPPQCRRRRKRIGAGRTAERRQALVCFCLCVPRDLGRRGWFWAPRPKTIRFAFTRLADQQSARLHCCNFCQDNNPLCTVERLIGACPQSDARAS